MRQKRSYLATILTAALLGIATLCSAILPTSAATVGYRLDYGISGNEGNTILSADELYESLFGVSPTPAETAYLSAQGISLTYNSMVPDSLISTVYDNEAFTLSLTIRPYSYKASNGSTVTWLPSRVLFDGKEFSVAESNGVYVGVMENVIHSADFNIQVDYTWSIEVPLDIIETMRKEAYQTGAMAISLQEAFLLADRNFKDQLVAHKAYTTYLSWQEDEDRYQADMAAFEASKEAYDTYVEELADYKIKKELYDAWQDYYRDAETYSTHKPLYDNYINYLSKMETVTKKLELMDSIYRTDSHKWQLYASVMGGSVTQVLARLEEVVDKLPGYKAFLKRANDATVVLRALLSEYNDLRKSTEALPEHQRVETLYGFYSTHYETLSTEFEALYTVLYEMFVKEPLVQREIKNQGKMDRYLQFVGQLYVITTCFDEDGARDSNWKILNKTLSDIVEPIHMVPDGSWDPHLTPCPSEVAPVEYMEPPVRPVQDPIPKPIEPDEVFEPEKPAEHENPYLSTGYPPKVDHPGKAPTAPTFDSLTKSLMQEIEDGVLTPYEGDCSEKTLTFTSTVERLVSIENKKTVTFYNHDGTEILHRITVEYGEIPDERFYVVPERVDEKNPPKYEYTTNGWKTADGMRAERGAVYEDLSLYASYTSKLCRYQITWIFGDQQETVLWGYDTTPQPPTAWSFQSYEQDHRLYTFSGWDTPIAPVTGNATYKGEMIPTLLNYTVTWVLYGDRTVTKTLPALTPIPAFEGDTAHPSDGTFRYNFLYWSGQSGPLTGNTTLIATYEAIKLATGGIGSTSLSVQHLSGEVRVSVGAHTSVEFFEALTLAKEQGKRFSLQWDNGISVSLSTDTLDSLIGDGLSRVRIDTQTEGDRTYLNISFRDRSGRTISQLSSGVTVKLPVSESGVGETVYFLLSEDGTETRLEGRSATLSGGARLYARTAYRLTATPDPHCNTAILPELVPVNDTVSLALPCFYGYRIAFCEVRLADGTLVELSKDLTFQMPSAPVLVTIKTEQIRYTVTFLVEGEVVSRAEYTTGEEILLPNAPEKAPLDGYVYTFVGWGKVPALASGDVYDMVFEATFSRALENVQYDSGYEGSLLTSVILPIAGIACLIIATPIAVIVIVRVCRKRARSNK